MAEHPGQGDAGGVDAHRTVALWLFAADTYRERPEFVEAVIQTALANPHPFTDVGFMCQGEAVRTHDSLDRLPGLTCPTLISVAADDILVPPRFSRQIAAALPKAPFRTFPNLGHGYFWEDPGQFNAMCLDFLAQQTGS